MIGNIRKPRQNQPCVPFTVHLADGRPFQVPTAGHFLIVGNRAVVPDADLAALPSEGAE